MDYRKFVTDKLDHKIAPQDIIASVMERMEDEGRLKLLAIAQAGDYHQADSIVRVAAKRTLRSRR